MEFYRFYQLERSGHICASAEALCATDLQALDLASRFWPAHAPAEVWRGRTMVGRVNVREPDAMWLLFRPSRGSQNRREQPARPYDETRPIAAPPPIGDRTLDSQRPEQQGAAPEPGMPIRHPITGRAGNLAIHPLQPSSC